MKASIITGIGVKAACRGRHRKEWCWYKVWNSWVKKVVCIYHHAHTETENSRAESRRRRGLKPFTLVECKNDTFHYQFFPWFTLTLSFIRCFVWPIPTTGSIAGENIAQIDESRVPVFLSAPLREILLHETGGYPISLDFDSDSDWRRKKQLQIL